MSIDLSVIIPVYRAKASLGRALASIDVPPGMSVEVILSVDDGEDYTAFADQYPRVRILNTGAVRTGPGPARNRGVAAARGGYLAYLDADDSWSPGYLAHLVPRAQVEGCAFAPTVIERADGTVLLRVPSPQQDQPQDRLMLHDFVKWGASFHPVHAAGLPRGTADGPFWNAPAQDVMHAVEVFMACGLTAALMQGASYRLRLGESTVTTGEGFSARLTTAYANYEQALQQTWAKTLFSGKSALNDRYVRERLEGESFYAFIARINAASRIESP